MENQKTTASFREEFARLNPQQREAAEHLEGPVLVIAGPGTGKTQIIAARIGNILSSPDTQVYPQNILCLTYTDAGVVAMRKRLLDFIGPTAYRVHIYTFHGFCNEVIRQNPDYFGKRTLEPISDLEKIDLLRELIDSLDMKHPLKRFKNDAYFEVDRLNNLFDVMKREDWTPDFVNDRINKYLDDIPLRDEYIYKKANAKQGIKAGDIKQHLIDAEIRRMEMLRSAVNLFPAFQELMLKHDRYDYSDMILWVVKAFREDQNFLRNYQERYLYFLVDEFQDTNGAQNEILNLLTDFWNKPNVFCVGDDDQSIYEFQGARLKNIMEFYEKNKKDITSIVLKENYRSTQNILDASKALIDHNEERLINQLKDLHLDKTLVAASEHKSPAEKPMIAEFQNVAQEEAFIVEEIEKLKRQQIPLNEIAIIYRKHGQAENILQLFDKKNIPYQVKKKINLLDLPVVQQLLNVFRYLDEETKQPHSAEFILFEMMHYRFIGIHPHDILKITTYASQKENKKSWREILCNEKILLALQLENKNAVSRLGKNISEWLSDIHNFTLQILFEKIINESGLLSFILQTEEKVWLMEVLRTFFDFIKTESAKSPRLRISNLFNLIEQMETHKLGIPVNKTAFREEGVFFTTAHSAKGLEFKYVFLIGCTSDKWEKARGGQGNYSLPDTLTFTKEENKIESSRRLFYVAMTRAKEFLHISFPKLNNDGKELETTQFIAEIMEKTDLQIQPQSIDNEKLFELNVASLRERAKPVIELFDEDYINDVLENFEMSASALNCYLDCPVGFYYQYILRVPGAKSDAMAFGNAVHYALNRLFANLKKSPQQKFHSEEEFVKDFVFEMYRNKDSFTAKQFELRIALGKQILPEYYLKYVYTWNKIAVTEYFIRNTEVAGVPVKGKLDKIEFHGNDVNVVDYKTGNPQYAKDKVKPPDEKNPNGGDYWRQILFYKILLDNHRLQRWNMVSGEIDFIEKDAAKNDFVQWRIAVVKEHIDIVIAQIRDTYQKIKNHEFAEGCGKEDCEWCKFVKENNLNKKPVQLLNA